MADGSVVHHTFTIERSYSKSPAQVFRAFSDPAKKKRWFGEGEHHALEEFDMDFHEGGFERIRSRFKPGTPFPGAALVAEYMFLDIVPDQRIVTSSTMSLGGKRFSASLVTMELVPNGEGTTVVCTHQGAFFEGADGPELRKQGWQQLLERLAEELAK